MHSRPYFYCHCEERKEAIEKAISQSLWGINARKQLSQEMLVIIDLAFQELDLAGIYHASTFH